MAYLRIAPPGLKPIQSYLKIAEEHEKRDPAITYWCRFYAVQAGLKVDDKSPENRPFLISLMDWLEKEKKTRHDDETISNDVVAQAHIENYALKLFLWADNEDRAGRFNKNVVKAFYTAGFLYDVVNTFGEPSEEVLHHRKYAKWKSTYIHNCLKNGEIPKPGPAAMEGDDNGDSLEGSEFNSNSPQSNMPPAAAPYNSVSDQPNPPYPPAGFMGPNYNLEGMNLPMPGTHAPPSTPSGAGQLSPSTSTANIAPSAEKTGEASLRPEDFQKAQKYCKWAGSALQYEDVATAVLNLQKALRLLTTGEDK